MNSDARSESSAHRPLTLLGAAEALRAGTVTSVELTESMLRRADAIDPLLGVYTTRLDDTARETAIRMDEEFARGNDHGLLQGIPMGVKDNLLTAEAGTTANSTALDPGWGLGCDATAVSRLKAAGAVLTGKLTTMEFAIGLCDSDKPFATPRNPWNPDAWPGGSSSGSASGIASKLFLGSLGSDTAASIRTPAAFCGVTGLKPTFGRVPTRGCIPFSYSLDHVGPIARTAQDCAAILQVIAGYESQDPTSSMTAVPDFLAGLANSIEGTNIGVARGLVGDDPDVNRAFDEALETLTSAGAVLVDIEVPMHEEILSATALTMAAEALSYHHNTLRDRWGDYSVGTREFLASGLLVSGAAYVQAQRVRRAAQNALSKLFRGIDMVALPTVRRAAPTYLELADRGLMSVFAEMNTAYWNAVGNPALALPMGFNSDRMPLSLQLAGRPYEEELVLRVGHSFQATTTWHLSDPSSGLDDRTPRS